MMLLVDLHVLCHGIVKLLHTLLEQLLRLLYLLLAALELDFCSSAWTRGSIAGAWDIDLTACAYTEVVHLTSALADQLGNLFLSNGDGRQVRVVNRILQQVEKLFASLISALLRAFDDDFVLRLRCSSSVSHTAGFGTTIYSFVRLSRARKIDADAVAILQAIDLAASRADQIAMVLWLDLEDVCRLVLPLLQVLQDVLLTGLALCLRALQFDLAIGDLDIHIKFLTEFLNVLAALANQEVGKFAGEFEGSGVPTLQLILLLLFQECQDLRH